MLPFGQTDDQSVQRVTHWDLAGEPGVGLRQRGEAQHARFLRTYGRGASFREPVFVDIDMTGRARAFAAAIGIDAGDVIIYCAPHYRNTERYVDPVLSTAEFNVGNLRHSDGFL